MHSFALFFFSPVQQYATTLKHLHLPDLSRRSSDASGNVEHMMLLVGNTKDGDRLI